MNRSLIAFVLSGLFCLTGAAFAQPNPSQAIQKLVKEVTPSLVGVQYTYEGELGRREFVGAGLVVRDDGLVMFTMSLTPIQLPDQQMKEFKILIPGDDPVEVDALFAGRDERSNVSFILPDPAAAKKPGQPTQWHPVKFVPIPSGVGDEIYSIGMLPKTASYQPYFNKATVSANLRGEIKQVLVTNEGLAAIGSPVFNTDGKAIGWVPMQSGQGITLNDPNPQAQMQAILSPPRTFTPTTEFAQSLADPPLPGKPVKIPWLGVAAMTGLKKEVAEFYGLTGQVAVQVGDVIPGAPAALGGLKPGNVIVKMNGQPLERGDEPDEAALILTKQVKRMKPGEKVVFSIITEPGKPAKDLTLTLTERPKPENQAQRFYAEDMGFTAREIVFEDTYKRKLPADQKGVVVALVKPSSAAQAGKLERGDLVTKLNQTPITDVEQFKKAYQDFRKATPKEAVVLEVIRAGNDEIIRIEPPQ